MFASGFVVVGYYHNPTFPKCFQRLPVNGSPFPRAHRIASCNQSQPGQCIYIFFAFNNKDALSRLGGKQFGKTIKNSANPIEVVNPSAFAIGPALAKVFRFIANRLEQKVFLFVPVIVLGNHSSRLTCFSRLRLSVGRWLRIAGSAVHEMAARLVVLFRQHILDFVPKFALFPCRLTTWVEVPNENIRRCLFVEVETVCHGTSGGIGSIVSVFTLDGRRHLFNVPYSPLNPVVSVGCFDYHKTLFSVRCQVSRLVVLPLVRSVEGVHLAG